MKTASTALINFLNAARAAPDAPIAFADCFTFTLSTGTVLTYTNVDQPIVYNGFTFAADGPLVQGLKYKASVGSRKSTSNRSRSRRGRPISSTARHSSTRCATAPLDGATVQRDRVFMSALGQTPVGGVTLFHGRVSTVDHGRAHQRDADHRVRPRRARLRHAAGTSIRRPACTRFTIRAAASCAEPTPRAGRSARGSTSSLINFSGALASHSQGSIVFTSGVNANMRATGQERRRRRLADADLSVADRLARRATPSPSMRAATTRAATCQSQFNNLANFRGFPFVPPPQIAY